MSHFATFPDPTRPDVFAPGHLGELTQIVPAEMVDAALESAGGTQRRLRRLPSRVVVYLLLAGALFTGQGWAHVWARLTCGLALVPSRPSASAVTEAMRRVGPGPLRELFTLLAASTLIRTRHTVRFAGHLVVAIDGTQIAVADTEANRVMFPKPRGGPNGQAGYPTVRVLAIVATGTRQVLDAVFGPDRTGELTYAQSLATALRPGMLLLADRNFASYKFFTAITTAGARFLIRARTGHGAMKLPVISTLPDGSYLSLAAGVKVRVIDAAVTISTQESTRTGHYRLITTLLDPATAPAARLIELYHERWQIETAYCEMKSTILGGRVLRGRHPGAVTQEVWALLAAYQVLRTAMSDAALDHPTIEPSRLSFTTALLTARDQIVQAAGAIAQTTIDLTGRIGAAVLADPLPARRTRTRPRVVKRAISKYRAKERDVDHRTYPATLHARVLTPAPDD